MMVTKEQHLKIKSSSSNLIKNRKFKRRMKEDDLVSLEHESKKKSTSLTRTRTTTTGIQLITKAVKVKNGLARRSAHKTISDILGFYIMSYSISQIALITILSHLLMVAFQFSMIIFPEVNALAIDRVSDNHNNYSSSSSAASKSGTTYYNSLVPNQYQSQTTKESTSLKENEHDEKEDNSNANANARNISSRQQDTRRPIWNLAHMVNSIKELDYRLSKGANAVEVDVTFSRFGDPLYTYHGPPCDCWRHCHQQEDFHEYLRYIRDITNSNPVSEKHQSTTTASLSTDNNNNNNNSSSDVGKNLTLLFLDLKLDYLDQLSKARAGVELAKSVRENLYAMNTAEEQRVTSSSSSSSSQQQPLVQNQQPIRLILSVNHVNDIDLVLNFVHHLEVNNASFLLKHIGFDVGMNDDLNLIESMWKKHGRQLNLWQGDGFTNCFSPFYNLQRLSKAVQKRDSLDGYPKKVYQWTIDLHDRLRESLRLGVDAIMTNHPERVLTVLKEPEMIHQFRLANRQDDPFKKITKQQMMLTQNERLPPTKRSIEPTSGGFLGGLFDVVASWIAYVKEIPFLSLPARYVSRAKHRSKSSASDFSVTGKNTQVIDAKTDTGTKRLDGEKSNVTTTNGTDSNSTSDTLEQILVGTTSANNTEQNSDEPLPYDGPKWYTTLISNFLVSILKLALPSP